MNSAFVAIESLRNAYNLLVKYVGSWLAQVIEYKEWVDMEYRMLYHMLGFCRTNGWITCDMPSSGLKRGSLLVAPAFRHRDDTAKLVTTLLLKGVVLRAMV